MFLDYTTTKKGNKVTINVKRFNNETMALDDIKAEGNKLLEKYKIKHSSMYIRGLNPLGFATLKALKANINFDDAEDYLDGRVRNPKKFDNYFQAQYTLFTTRHTEKKRKIADIFKELKRKY